MPHHPTPNLRRRIHRREPLKRFIIYCEGKNTEPAYFAALKHIYSRSLIQIETVSAAGVPYTLASSAVSQAKSLGLTRRNRRALNSFEENDEVWAVFDRDEHPRYDEAVIMCESAGVGVARSNPCFEVWLILHEEDFDRPDDRCGVQAHLQKIRPEYKRTAGKLPDCADLATRSDVAEHRAESQLNRREHEGSPYGRPSTTVWRLVRALRQAAQAAR